MQSFLYSICKSETIWNDILVWNTIKIILKHQGAILPWAIAGKNSASSESFGNALFAAIKIYHPQIESDELKKNPLPYSELKRERFRLEQG